MVSPRKLPKALQIRLLKRIFKKYNPNVDEKAIDWEADVDEDLSYHENYEELKRKYPYYNWGEEPTSEEGMREEFEENVKRGEEEKILESDVVKELIDEIRRTSEIDTLYALYSGMLIGAGIDPEKHKSEFDEEIGSLIGLDPESKRKAIVSLAKEVINKEKGGAKEEYKGEVVVKHVETPIEVQEKGYPKPIIRKPKIGGKWLYEEFVPEEKKQFFSAWMSSFESQYR